MTATRYIAFVLILHVVTSGPAVGQSALQNNATVPRKRNIAAGKTKQPDPNQKDSEKTVRSGVEQPSAPILDTKTTNSSEDIEIQRKLAKYTKWLVVVGAVQFIALIGQGVVFFLTLRSMSDTAQRQLRAYIGVSESGLKLQPENIPEGQVYIKNFGQTPAYNVRQWIAIALLPHPLPTNLPEPPEGFLTSTSLIPSGGHHINVVPVKQPIPADILALLATPELALYVYGRVVYEDIFGKERHTQYRLIYGGREGIRKKTTSNGILMGLMKFDSAGNKAD